MLYFTTPDPDLDLTGEDSAHCMNVRREAILLANSGVTYLACEVLYIA